MRNLGKYSRNISRIHEPTMRWNTAYLMEGLHCPGLSLCRLHIQRALPKDPPEPPLSPLLQLETMADHLYLMSPTTQPFTPHCPITQSPHLTYQNHLTGQRHTPGFTPRSQAWTHRPLHKTKSAAEAPSSDKERDLPRDKGPMAEREFVERGQSGFPRSRFIR